MTDIQELRAGQVTDVFTPDQRTMQIQNWDLYEYRSIEMVERGEASSIVETPAYARAKRTLDSLVVAGRPAWHGLGNYIADRDVLTSDEAIVEGGLDWEVERWPLAAALPMLDPDGKLMNPLTYGGEFKAFIDSHVAIVRKDTGVVMGIVGKGFVPVQNREAFAFLDELLATGDAKVHTAGATDEGRNVFICVMLDKDIRIGDIDDEKIDPFIVLTNAHDGTGALRNVVTPVRPACKNTARAAIRGASLSWFARHTKNVLKKADQARDTLQISFRYYDELKRVGDAMINQTVTDREFERIVEQLMPMPKGKDVTERMQDNVEAQRISLLSLAKNSPNLDNIRDTAWGRWNAVVEFADFLAPVRSTGRPLAERRFEKMVLDADAPLKDKAFELLTA